ncbi:hypothetical protein T484DRAFT_1834497 [Baffinella frigidus]|nr:hypothetical protein T484DRAFT_1834497 [Cryptophyta sp. CCMP2293]
MSGRGAPRGGGGGWQPRGGGRGGGAFPVFQPKKWVKPGSQAAVAAAATAAAVAALAEASPPAYPAEEAADIPSWADAGGGDPVPAPSRKWVKPGSEAALAAAATAAAVAALADAPPPSYPAEGAPAAESLPWAGAGGGDPVPAPSRKWVKPGLEAALPAAALAPAPAAPVADAPPPPYPGADAPPPAYPGTDAAPEADGLAWAGAGGGDPVPAPSRKWVKGEGAIPAGGRSPVLGSAGGRSPVQGAPAPVDPAFERGKQYNARQSPRTVGFGVRVTGHAGISICVSNLDMSVSEDNLWKFFNQAGRVFSVKAMPKKPGKPYKIVFVNFADHTPKVKAMPKKPGKPYKIAFVNFADHTPKVKCREMLATLQGSTPSWNHGVAIEVQEQEEREPREKKQTKRETPEEKEARLVELRKTRTKRETPEEKEARLVDLRKIFKPEALRFKKHSPPKPFVETLNP